VPLWVVVGVVLYSMPIMANTEAAMMQQMKLLRVFTS